MGVAVHFGAPHGQISQCVGLSDVYVDIMESSDRKAKLFWSHRVFKDVYLLQACWMQDQGSRYFHRHSAVIDPGSARPIQLIPTSPVLKIRARGK